MADLSLGAIALKECSIKKVVEPAAKREAAEYLIKNYQMSERLACRLVVQSLSTKRYKSRNKTFDGELKIKLIQLAQANQRFGYHRLRACLANQGIIVNHKKIYRLYKEAKLVLKITPSKKLRKAERLSMLMSSEFNECWSMDFVSDKLTDNRKIRCLNVIDNYSRYSITIEVASSLRAAAVIVILNKAIAKYGKPKTIEFRSKLLQLWAKDQQIRLHFIAPGKPTQNAYIESFNGKFRDECLNQHWFSTINEAKMTINNWRENYNVERPHSSLGYLPPKAFIRNNNNKLLY